MTYGNKFLVDSKYIKFPPPWNECLANSFLFIRRLFELSVSISVCWEVSVLSRKVSSFFNSELFCYFVWASSLISELYFLFTSDTQLLFPCQNQQNQQYFSIYTMIIPHVLLLSRSSCPEVQRSSHRSCYI